MSRLLVAASGTGGHLFPALAVADALPSTWKITWLGVPNRLETTLLPENYKLITIRVGGLFGSFLNKTKQIVLLFAASIKVASILKKQDIDLVFTTGGYIAAPAILGAIFSKTPVLLHESNAKPGRVTRLLGRFCDVVALGLPIRNDSLSSCRKVITGTPVRASFLCSQPQPDWLPLGSGPLIIVMGGSQGALGLNRMVRGVIPSLLNKGCRVVHLTGNNDPDIHEICHPNLVSKAFSHEIPALLQHADLVISRAGASALSEIAICETPAILVPYPSATDQHQDLNALRAAELGAAVIVHQHDEGEKTLNDVISRLLKIRLMERESSSDPLKYMKLGMKNLSIKDAEKKLVELIKSIILSTPSLQKE